MTRINCVPVQELCNQHLFAEFRELTRIPNGVRHGKLRTSYLDAPKQYTLGPGHVKFFVDKQAYLYKRYLQLVKELKARRYSIEVQPFSEWIATFKDLGVWNDWTPDDAALAANRARIKDRMPAVPHWSKKHVA